MRLDEARPGIPRVPSGVTGFDLLSFGGLPATRTTLVSGSAGAGKTTFALQFLLGGIWEEGQNGVLVSCEEAPDEMQRNVAAFGWGFDELVSGDRLAIVDASPQPEDFAEEVGEFDFSALLARIQAEVERIGAQRLVLDSVNALFGQFRSPTAVRRELQRVLAWSKRLGLTTVVTTERTEEYGPIGRYEVEEFVVDCAVILRNPFDGQRRRRTIEILKLRGGNHRKGEYPFTIQGNGGIEVIPLSAVELEKAASREAASLGNEGLDEMLGGGIFSDSVLLVSGATGTGKTCMVSEFMRPVVDQGERGLLMTFEESHDQILRNAAGWGVDLESAERDGRLEVLSVYPERMGLEDLLIALRRTMDRLHPSRVSIDSLTALERISTPRAYREFIVGLVTLLKESETFALLTYTASSLLGGDSVTEAYISTMSDGIFLLRYVEHEQEIRRAVAVLKMRGSRHDLSVREYTIDAGGMTIGEPLRSSGDFLGPATTHGGNPSTEPKPPRFAPPQQ